MIHLGLKYTLCLCLPKDSVVVEAVLAPLLLSSKPQAWLFSRDSYNMHPCIRRCLATVHLAATAPLVVELRRCANVAHICYGTSHSKSEPTDHS